MDTMFQKILIRKAAGSSPERLERHKADYGERLSGLNEDVKGWFEKIRRAKGVKCFQRDAEGRWESGQRKSIASSKKKK